MVRIKSQPTQVLGSWSPWVFQQVLDPHLVPCPAIFQALWDWDEESGYVLTMQFLRAWEQMSSQVLCLSGCCCCYFFLLEKGILVPSHRGRSHCVYSRCCSAVRLPSAPCQNILVMQDCTGVETKA